jgi:S1-C subfamily serine protease
VIRPWLGIKGKFVTDELRNLIALPLVSGVLIVDVDEKSPAESIGLRAGSLDVTIEGESWVLGGDILVAVDGHNVKTIEQYNSVVGPLKVGQSIQLTVVRNGDYLIKSVTLGERPTPPISQQHPRFEAPLVAPQSLEDLPF